MCVCTLSCLMYSTVSKLRFLKSSKNRFTHFVPKNGLSKRKFHICNDILSNDLLKYVIHNTGTTLMHRPFDSTLISSTSQYLYLGFSKASFLKLCGLLTRGRAWGCTGKHIDLVSVADYNQLFLHALTFSLT